MSTISAVDLAAFFAASEQEQKRIAAQVDEICRHTGFLIIKNHGIPQEVIDTAWSAVHAFFDLPLEQKLAVKSPDPGCPRGYFPMASEALAKSLGVDTPPDIKESFGVGTLKPPKRDVPADKLEFHYGKNLWPENPQGIRDALTRYMLEAQALGDRVLQLFAAALSLPQDYFAESHTDSMVALRCLSYPATDEAPLADQKGAGEHADYGSITMLKSDPNVPGLEVRLPSGEWISAPLVADGFIVNIGDMMARWSNDRWVSTLHRVISPGQEGGGQSRRQSMAFFYNASFDAPITCIPTCLDADATPKYGTVEAGEYLKQRFSAALEEQPEPPRR
jgi:isopenicillin N synthase-like dioxygenase